MKLVKTVRYYAPYAKQGVSVLVRDSEGKLVPLKDGQGNQKYAKGVPQWQTRLIEFVTQVGYRTNVNECLSFYAVDFVEGPDGKPVPVKPEEYEALEKLADDPGTKIEREVEYKQRRNPEAFERETELNAVKTELEELKRVKAEGQSGTAEMLAEMERLKRELKAAKKRTGKEENGDLLE